MNFKGKKGDERKDPRGSARQGRQTGMEERFDARPDSPPGGRPRNIQETKAWKDGSKGAKQIWTNYVETLKRYFRQMPRANQEQLITRVSMIVTMGVAVLLLEFFYNYLPPMVKILLVPLALFGAWWAGTKIVASVMIVRFDEYLNREF